VHFTGDIVIGRTGADCRRRYHNHVNPSINRALFAALSTERPFRAPFAAEEDQKIVAMQAAKGSQ
jgi:hypothetical protein